MTHTHFCMITKLVKYEADISRCFILPFLSADVGRFQECVKPVSTCYGTLEPYKCIIRATIHTHILPCILNKYYLIYL